MASALDVRELIDAHYQSLYRYAYRLSGSPTEAEDLTQETFGKAITHLHELRQPDRAKGWLYRVLRNVYLHRVRDDRRNLRVPIDAVGEVMAREAPPEPMVESAKLQAALNELDEAFRTPIILFYFDEMSYRDIAEQLDLPIGTVMSRLARAKAYLKAKLHTEVGPS